MRFAKFKRHKIDKDVVSVRVDKGTAQNRHSLFFISKLLERVLSKSLSIWYHFLEWREATQYAKSLGGG